MTCQRPPKKNGTSHVVRTQQKKSKKMYRDQSLTKMLHSKNWITYFGWCSDGLWKLRFLLLNVHHQNQTIPVVSGPPLQKHSKRSNNFNQPIQSQTKYQQKVSHIPQRGPFTFQIFRRVAPGHDSAIHLDACKGSYRGLDLLHPKSTTITTSTQGGWAVVGANVERLMVEILNHLGNLITSWKV